MQMKSRIRLFFVAVLQIFVFLSTQRGVSAFVPFPSAQQIGTSQKCLQSSGFRLQAKEGDKSSVSRRRQRRQGEQSEAAAAPAATDTPRQQQQPIQQQQQGRTTSRDESIEDLFGLGNEQLRELMEQELPVPREDLITGGKEVESEEKDDNKVFRLPDLVKFGKTSDDAMQASDRMGGNERRERYITDESTKKKNKNRRDAESGGEETQKIDRSNREEYMRVMQLNPFADADDSMFLDEYDIIPSIFGSGKLLGIPVPYLQTGHGILLIIASLAGFVYAPGNPLTEFPVEIRDFLKTGLGVVYSINTVLAVQAFFNARSKNLPPLFWAAKTFILGGVAYYEITQAEDPKDIGKGLDPRTLRRANRENKGPRPEDKFR